jgi:DNA-binding response OmpR family regulator
MARLAKKKILIAEDEEIIANSLRLCLQEQGYEVLSPVATGEEAIESVRAYKPDLVLIDVRLRGTMSGICAMMKVRFFSNVPVIYTTGGAPMEIYEQMRVTQPADCVIKPFSIEELVAKIECLTVPKASSR